MNRFSLNSIGECVENCLPGTVPINNSCENCSENCRTCLNKDECKVCENNYYLQNKRCVPYCEYGYYRYNDYSCLGNRVS